MTAKEWLKRSDNAFLEIEQIRERLEFARLRAEKITPTLSHESGGGDHDPHEKFDNVLFWEEKLNKKTERLEAIEREISEAIDSIDGAKDSDRMRTVLTARYVNHMKWEAVASTMYCSVRSVHRLHGRALTALKDGIECHTDNVI